jgi:O-antigen ligase
VLYGVVPGVFFILLLVEQKFFLINKSLNFYILFVAWASLSLIYTVNQEMTANYITILLGNIVLWYSAYRIVINTNNYIGLLFILGISLLYNAFQGYVTPVEVSEKVGYGRATGLFSNSNALGFIMWYGIVICTSLFLLRKNKLLMRIGLITVACLFVYVLISSGSRKNAIALVFFLASLIFFLSKGRYKVIALLFLVASAMIYVTYGEGLLADTTLGQRLEGETIERGGENRLSLIKEGFSFFFNSPLFGIGLGSFTTYSSIGKMSHNDYIEVLSSTGLLGFILYAVIYVHFFKQNLRLMRHAETRKLGALLQAFLLSFLLLGLGRPSFLDPTAMLVLGFFQALAQKGNQHLNNMIK